MAITKLNLKFLRALRDGARGGRMLCLGRQHWCGERSPFATRPFADLHLRSALALDTVESLDISSDDGATHVHDLNDPLPDHLRGQFDLVYDGGTIEHCFDPVTALDNCALALRVGGWFASHQLLNLAGHGFWTLSPELLSKWAISRGFDARLCEVYRLGPWPRVHPVDLTRPGRIELTSILPLNMHFAARKAAMTMPHMLFARPTQHGPSLTDPFRYWLNEARTWAKN